MARAKRCGSNAWRRNNQRRPLVSNEVGRDVCFGKARRLHEDFANDIFADGIDAVSCHCWAIHRRPRRHGYRSWHCGRLECLRLFFLGQGRALLQRGTTRVAGTAPSLVRRDGTARREGEYSGAEAVRCAGSRAERVCDRPQSASRLGRGDAGAPGIDERRRTGGRDCARTVARAELRHSHQRRRGNSCGSDHVSCTHGILVRRRWRSRRPRSWRRRDSHASSDLPCSPRRRTSAAGSFSPARVQRRRNGRTHGRSSVRLNQRIAKTGRVQQSHSHDADFADDKRALHRQASLRRWNIFIVVQHAPAARGSDRDVARIGRDTTTLARTKFHYGKPCKVCQCSKIPRCCTKSATCLFSIFYAGSREPTTLDFHLLPYECGCWPPRGIAEGALVMSCRDTIHLICWYLEGKLSPSVSKDIEQHLGSCANCRVVLSAATTTLDQYFATLSEPNSTTSPQAA